MSHIPVSYSKINTFKLCPLKFKAQYLDKSYPDEGDNPNFLRGNAIHKNLEDYVVARLAQREPPSLCKEAKNAQPIVDSVLSSHETVSPEMKICLDKDFQLASWFDNSKAYFRCIVDLLGIRNKTHAIVIDYKTGKVRDYQEDRGQLHLTAGALFAMYPEIEHITMAYLFVDHKQTVKVEFTRADAPQLQGYIVDYFDEINNEKEFEPTVNKYCFFCKLTKADCKFK